MSVPLKDCRPVLLGLRGPRLTADDVAAIRETRPVGVLLFARNIETVAQVRALCAELAAWLPEVGGAPLIAVDQEGGRVQRLHFHGRNLPAAAFGAWHDAAPGDAVRAAYLNALLLAADLREVGATWVLAPCVDLAFAETHAIIGDRAYHADAGVVTALARAHLAGTAAGGCYGCLKHAPGHGRARADSHVELPTVWAPRDALEAADWGPYAALGAAADFIMTAHISYPSVQGIEGVPATFDGGMLDALRSAWAFKGLLVADDLGMQALDGSYASRAERAVAGGCDLLICSFSRLVHGMAGTVFDEQAFADFRAGLEGIPVLGERALACLAGLRLPPGPDAGAVSAARDEMRALWASSGAGACEALGYTLAA